MTDVFINCPFDDKYTPLFEAILFSVTVSGYRVRCALEENDSGDIRFDKLCRLISESSRSIHDLSRVEVAAGEMPRFNMPFELGLWLGAKRFGSDDQKAKSTLIFIREDYKLPTYLSDLGGNDPKPHKDSVANVIKAVRDYLHVRPQKTLLPGAKAMQDHLVKFTSRLPIYAKQAKIAVDEVHPRTDHNTYMTFLTAFVKEEPLV